MAKAGLDYFPLDVTMDAKMELIEAEFGLTGFGVIVHLLQEIYGKAGYYIEWTNEVALLFARKVGLGGSAVSEIVDASIRRGMFDKEIFDKYQILTSKGIQKRYFEAVSRRKSLEVDFNILLVDCANFLKNADIKRVNVNILSKNAYISEQSKVEKSRVKKSKEDIGADKPPRQTRFVSPTVEEVRAYCLERKNSVDPEKFVSFYAAKGWMIGKNKMKDWKQAVITWERGSSRGKGADTGADSRRPKDKWDGYDLGGVRLD